MKIFYDVVIVLVLALSCKQKEKSFDRIYFVEYGYSLRWLPENFEGIPPVYIRSFLKIESNGITINGNRLSQKDTTMLFSKISLDDNLFDSLNFLLKIYDKDTTFGIWDEDHPTIYDGYNYSFLI